jgi:predicted RNA-binding protein YlqC (UPF0109 family)
VQEFLEYVIRQLIEFPDEMVITRIDQPRRTIFRLRLRPSDVGKVIGKHGHTIAAIRNLLSAAAARHNEKAVLQIVEEEPETPHTTSDRPEPAREHQPAPAPASDTEPGVTVGNQAAISTQSEEKTSPAPE